MKIEARTSDTTRKVLEFVVTHEDQALCFDGGTFDRKSIENQDQIFRHFNLYMSRQTPMFQEKVFQVFGAIRSVFDDFYDPSKMNTNGSVYLISNLTPLVRSLYEDFDLNDLENWISFHSDIIIPDKKFEEVYIESDEKPGTREKTYLYSDYQKLIALSIAIRAMLPVWGEFINLTKAETGVRFKEFYAAQLLNDCKLSMCEAMDKLKTYVSSLIMADKELSHFILSGIGTQDFADWLVGLVLVRRLSMGDYAGTNKDTTLITYIYNYVNPKTAGINNNAFHAMVRYKEFDKGEGEGDDHSSSRLEGYKIKLKLPIGDISILENYLNNPMRVFKSYGMTMNDELMKLFNMFMQQTVALESKTIDPAQVSICQYVLAKVIPARSLTHISKRQVLIAIAITQTILWLNGYKSLTALVGAYALESSNSQLSSFDSKARIPKELADRIEELYPYKKITQAMGRNQSISSKRKGKVNTIIFDTIDDLTASFSKQDWVINLPEEYIKDITNSDSRRFACPYDFKITLTKLIIAVQEKTLAK